MPNTPVLVGCGATVYTRGKYATDKDAEIAEKLFSAVGICEEVPENLIDPVTALASSGPAYVSVLFTMFYVYLNRKSYWTSLFIFKEIIRLINKRIFLQVYMMIEAMADGGVKMGLNRSIAYKLAAQTVLGAGTMVRETNIHPAQLKDDVASPGG